MLYNRTVKTNGGTSSLNSHYFNLYLKMLSNNIRDCSFYKR